MYEEDFPARLARLRAAKGVSSRDMSLSIGQNAGYISNIECGKALPSMSVFFFICEYLNITPRDFFDIEIQHPERLQNLISDLKQLDNEQLDAIEKLVHILIRKK